MVSRSTTSLVQYAGSVAHFPSRRNIADIYKSEVQYIEHLQVHMSAPGAIYILPELGKVTLKSNGDEALSDESP
jgi:hypothetical protein